MAGAYTRTVVVASGMSYGPLSQFAPEFQVRDEHGNTPSEEPQALAFLVPDGSCQVVVVLDENGKENLSRILNGGVIVANKLPAQPTQLPVERAVRAG